LIPAPVLDLVTPLITEFEKGPSGSFAATAYRDIGGNWTIGWGHKLTVNDPLLSATITADQADDLRGKDLDRQWRYLQACLGETWTEMKCGQQAALVDFCFNLGIGQFETSTLHHYVETGRSDMVPGELMKWVHAGKPPVKQGGLVKRRAAEAKLWVLNA
jgi:lysozyme